MHLELRGSGPAYRRPANTLKVAIGGQSLHSDTYSTAARLAAFENALKGAAGFADADILQIAYSGTYASEETATAAGGSTADAWWNVTGDTAGARLTAALAVVSPKKSRLAVAGWNQGQASTAAARGAYAGSGYSAATAIANFKTSSAAIWAAIRAEAGWNVPIVVTLLGRRSTDTPGGMEAIRQAQLDLIAEGTNIYKGPETYDLPLRDVVHHTEAAILSDYIPRLASALAHRGLGVGNGWLGPSITSWTKIDATTVDVEIAPDAGDTFTKPASPQHFRIEDSGTPGTALSISGFTWNGNTLRISLSDPLTNDVLPYYPYDFLPDWEDELEPDTSSVIKGTNSGYPLQTWHRS